MNLNSEFLLGVSLLFFYKERCQPKITSNFSKIVRENNLCVNDDQWIFMFGKFGNIVGAAWLSNVIAKNNIIKMMSTENINANSKKDLWLELKFFWAEIGSGKNFIKYLRNQLKLRCAGLIYLRVKNGKRITKLISSNEATTFMRAEKVHLAEINTSFLQTVAARDFYLPTYNTQMAFAQCVGEMALLMVHSPVAAASPFRPVMERIQTCVQLKQQHIYASTDDTKTGLLTWAWLSSSRIMVGTFDTNALQAFEWSEGPHLAVVDVVVSPETEIMVWADLAGQLYPDEDIWILCRAEGKTYFKKWSKDQRSEFLTNIQARAGIAIGTWKNISMEPLCKQ